MNSLSKLLFFFGFLFLIFGSFLIWQRYTPKKLAFENLEVNAKNSSDDIKPIKIIIPDLEIENNIYSAVIKNNKWQATANGISYLSSSPIPGEKGNSVLYGHNWESILGKLVKIRPGEKIEILMSNGETRKFIVEFTSVVDPNQTNILAQTSDKRITLYTCTGFLDTKRFVATAKLLN